MQVTENYWIRQVGWMSTGGVILFVSSTYVSDGAFIGWLIVPTMVVLLIGGLKLIPVLQRPLEKLGMISLESYLTNTSINKL